MFVQTYLMPDVTNRLLLLVVNICFFPVFLGGELKPKTLAKLRRNGNKFNRYFEVFESPNIKPLQQVRQKRCSFKTSEKVWILSSRVCYAHEQPRVTNYTLWRSGGVSMRRCSKPLLVHELCQYIFEAQHGFKRSNKQSISAYPICFLCVFGTKAKCFEPLKIWIAIVPAFDTIWCSTMVPPTNKSRYGAWMRLFQLTSS